jgi:hypothetical protein
MAAMSITAATTCSSFPSKPGWNITSYSRATCLPLPRLAWRRSLLAASPPARRLRIRPRTSASASPATAYDYEASNSSLLLTIHSSSLFVCLLPLSGYALCTHSLLNKSFPRFPQFCHLTVPDYSLIRATRYHYRLQC